MRRRQVLSFAGLAALGVTSFARTAGAEGTGLLEPGSDNRMIPLVRIYADEAGESRIEQLLLDPANMSVPMRDGIFVQNPVGETNLHTVPGRSFSVNLQGTLEVTTSRGANAIIGPGQLCFLEDTVGKGHKAVFQSPITTFVVYVDESFDLGAHTVKA